MRSSLSVSVVITTRNSARTIGRCLESLVPYQERGEISEVIVVDSHSADGTVEIVRSYPVKLLLEEGVKDYSDSTIRARYSTYQALDQGWRNACGDLVMFLDSDAYLGQDFFPQALAFFVDEKLGVLGCWAKAWVSTPLTQTIGQIWAFHGERLRIIQNNSHHPFDRLYRLVTFFGAKRLYASGPCYIVRRSCLELLGGHDVSGDVGISLRLDERGWRSWWWVDAPVCHLPKGDLRGLYRQHYLWGRAEAYASMGARPLVLHPLRIGGAVALGVFLAVRYRAPRHLVALPLAEVSSFAGCVAGLVARARGKL